MKAHFAEVLARESIRLAAVNDGAELAVWRAQLVGELMTPRSPYALALRKPGPVPTERAEFLRRWQGLIARTLDRVVRSGGGAGSACPRSPSGPAAVDPERTAVLILAAVHGGCTLSRVAQDPWPLDAALDMALAPLTSSGGPGDDNTGSIDAGQ